MRRMTTYTMVLMLIALLLVIVTALVYLIPVPDEGEEPIPGVRRLAFHPHTYRFAIKRGDERRCAVSVANGGKNAAIFTVVVKINNSAVVAECSGPGSADTPLLLAAGKTADVQIALSARRAAPGRHQIILGLRKVTPKATREVDACPVFVTIPGEPASRKAETKPAAQ